MISILVSAAGKPAGLTLPLPITVVVPNKTAEDVTIADVKEAIAAKIPKFHPTRQKITLKGEKTPLVDETTLEQAGVSADGELSVKDLGPQVNWRFVYFVEYIGPLIIHPLIYHFPKVFYGGPVQHSQLQLYVYVLVMLHFIKREFETIFIHRFSRETMPFRNIFKNSAHYYLLSGVVLAYPLYGPSYSASSPHIRNTIREKPQFLWACVILWAFAELSNLKAHLTLRSLRPVGTRQRAIPYGYGFAFVSCPHYFFELLAWLVIVVMTGNWASTIFFFISASQMVIWATKKHKGYKKEFGKDYPRDRKIMIPYIF